jgi:predicted acyltransferase
MFWILGADAVVQVAAKVWDVAPLRFLAGQVDHHEWEGVAFYDLIFPLFVFIVGVSLTFSLSKIIAEHGRPEAVQRILRRALLLILLGVFYNGGVTNAWPGVRLSGVLQTMGVAYAGAGLLFCFVRTRALAAAAVLILLGYWALLAFVPIRDIRLEKNAMIARLGTPKPTREQVRQAYDATTAYVTGHYEPGLNVANHFDFNYLPGRKYDTYWDPEGPLNMISAIATCLIGVLAGLGLRRADRADAQKITLMVASGVALLAIGFGWGHWLPVVKKIWSPSFVLVAGGWSLLFLAAFYYLVDVRKWRRWCVPFVWIGMNPITLYLATAVVNFERLSGRFVGGSVKAFFDAHLAPDAGDLVLCVVALALLLALARFLYQRKIFLRV